MTCISGLVDGTRVLIGGDSLGSAGWDSERRADPKVFKRGGILFGYTSSYRMGQLLRFKLTIPEQPRKMDDYEYLCTLFIDAVRDCLKNNGFALVKDSKESFGQFLIGYKEKLYRIDDDLQVGIPLSGYTAVGCGAGYAIGSLATSTGTAEQRIIKSLEVAEEFSNGVRGPFHIAKLLKGGGK